MGPSSRTLRSAGFACVLLLGVGFAWAQDATEILLWPGGAPGAMGTAVVDKPAIVVWPAMAGRETGMGVVVCPGGGYSDLTWEREGTGIAQWLAECGIRAFILRYRVAPYRHPIPMNDAKRAMRTVRARAAEFGVDPDRLGIMGFSAGGHVASTVATHFDTGDPQASDPIEQQSCRPDFVVLNYSVISMRDNVTHEGSRSNLLGNSPDPSLITYLSNELQVTSQTPPSFLSHGTADWLSTDNSTLFHEACLDSGVPSKLVLLEGAEHSYAASSLWTHTCLDWLFGLGLVSPSMPSAALNTDTSTAPCRWEFLPNGVFKDTRAFVGDRQRDCGGDCFMWDCGTRINSLCLMGWVDRGDWVMYEQVDFECGLTGLACYAARDGGEGYLEFVLDNLNGTKICTLAIQPTGGWTTFDTSKIAIDPPVTGTHDVYAIGAGDGSAGTFTFTFLYKSSDGATGSATNWVDERMPGDGDSIDMTCAGTFACYDTVYWNSSIRPAYLKLRSLNTVFDFRPLMQAGADTLRVDVLDHTVGRLHLPAGFVIEAGAAVVGGTPRTNSVVTSSTDPAFVSGEGIIRTGDPAKAAARRPSLFAGKVPARVAGGRIVLGRSVERVEIFDAAGAMVLSEGPCRRIDVRDLASGTYLLRLSRGPLSAHVRLVVPSAP